MSFELGSGFSFNGFGENSFLLSEVLDILFVDLSSITSPQTAGKLDFLEGFDEEIINLVDKINGLDEWGQGVSVSPKIQYLGTVGDNTSWTDITETGFMGLIPDEYELRSLSRGRIGFKVKPNSITNDIDDRLRFIILLEDSNMATLQLFVPFDVESLISANSLAAITNVSARTYREGAALDTFGLAQFISGLTNWSDVHWDSAGAVVRVSEDSGGTWATHSSEKDGLETSEYTLNTGDLLANGNIGFNLHAEAIPSNIAHDDAIRFEIYITMVSGSTTRYVRIPITLLAPTDVSSLTGSQTASSRTYREGDAITRFTIADLVSGISAIDDLNLDSADIVVQYLNLSNVWTDYTALAFMDLLREEWTLENDIRASGSDRGTVGFKIHPDSVGDSITGKLRFKITMTDES